MHLTTKQNMTHVEKLHLDCLQSPQVEEELIRAEPDIALKKLAAITENISIEFAEWLNNNSYCWNWYYKKYTKYRIVLPIPESDLKTAKDLFQEYLKTKENEAKIHMVK